MAARTFTSMNHRSGCDLQSHVLTTHVPTYVEETPNVHQTILISHELPPPPSSANSSHASSSTLNSGSLCGESSQRCLCSGLELDRTLSGCESGLA
ncbi:hypothetical protein M3J09_004064 [Ascochyta lentis]